MKLFGEYQVRTLTEQTARLLSLARDGHWEQLNIPESENLLRLAAETKEFALFEPVAHRHYDLALRRAVFGKKKALTLALLPEVRNINIQTGPRTKNRTALHFAALWNEEILEALLRADAYVNADDADGNTPLHLVCERQDIRSARKLFAAGATIPCNKQGNTPLQLLHAQSHAENPLFSLELIQIASRVLNRPSLTQSPHAWLIDPSQIRTYTQMNSPRWQEKTFEEKQCEWGYFSQVLNKFKIKHLEALELIKIENSYSFEFSFHNLITTLLQDPYFSMVTTAKSEMELQEMASYAAFMMQLEKKLGGTVELIVKPNGKDFFIISQRPITDEKFSMLPAELISRAGNKSLLVDGKNLSLLVESLNNKSGARATPSL